MRTSLYRHASMEKSNSNEQKLLILGDGDFSWSLDLARHLFAMAQHEASPISSEKPIRLLVTGIDSDEEFAHKYRNSGSIAQQLGKLRRSADECGLHIQMIHGINAIVTNIKENELSQQSKADVVIFNHPHLGTENAKLHSCFLSHLFHSIFHHWLSNDGYFYITLALGQFERWNCLKAASRHSMYLIRRCTFLATPSAINNPCYEHRRHQTGKSFASRTLGSETFCFRKTDKEGLERPWLPWFESKTTNNTDILPLFRCVHCNKSFREERSRKNHILSKHSTASTDVKTEYVAGKRKRLESVPKFTCKHCVASATVDINDCRVFDSSRALLAHIRAKHSPHVDTDSNLGISDSLMNDPSMREVSLLDSNSKPAHRKACEICELPFISKNDETGHANMFVPKIASKSACMLCQFCNKAFQQQRALSQHLNFCSFSSSVQPSATS